MKIHIVDNIRYLDLQEKGKLKKQVKLILNTLNLSKNTEVCITFLDDNAMRKLNETYRGIKRTTDVLSFPQDKGDSIGLNAAIAKGNIKNEILGDIVISIDTAKRHAGFYGNSLEKEIQKLIIHGILHLLGYDHKKKNNAIVMKKREKELLSLMASR
ncbi:MAG: rRNA maturation RNase YbeY [Candidatus Dadabacteria bacterium]